MNNGVTSRHYPEPNELIANITHSLNAMPKKASCCTLSTARLLVNLSVERWKFATNRCNEHCYSINVVFYSNTTLIRLMPSDQLLRLIKDDVVNLVMPVTELTDNKGA